MGTLNMREQYGGSEEDDSEEVLKETPVDGVNDAPQEEEEQPKKEESETEEPTEDAPEESPSEEKEEVDTNDSAQRLKELEALELQKKALLQDIVSLRSERRTLKSEDVFVDKKKQETEAPLELPDVAEQDVKLIEKVVKSLGYVRKDEIVQQTHKQTVDSLKDQWLAAHPEYLPENDPKDVRWNALNNTMKNLFEVMPSDPKKITKMLDIAHKEIQSSISLPVKSKASIDAAKEKISVSGKGGSGGSASKTTPERQNVGTKIHPSYLKGFTDEEIAELTQ